jgi:hypothetical protein
LGTDVTLENVQWMPDSTHFLTPKHILAGAPPFVKVWGLDGKPSRTLKTPEA